jgi:hypothetical protein
MQGMLVMKSNSTSGSNPASTEPSSPGAADEKKQEDEGLTPDRSIDTYAYPTLNSKLSSNIENNKITAAKNENIDEQNKAIALKNEEILEESKKIPEIKRLAPKAVEELQGNYRAFIQGANKAYIFFYNNKSAMEAESKKCDEGIVLSTLGLKFHISLPEDVQNKIMLYNGWDIVKTIFIDNDLFFKVLREEYIKDIKLDDHGKLITLYANNNPNMTIEKWRLILENVTQRLEDNLIEPGPRATSTKDKPEEYINGSRFISYRYDDECNAYEKLKAKITPNKKKPIGSAAVEKARLEKAAAEETLNLIQRLVGGVISEGPKRGWPVNDPIKALIVTPKNRTTVASDPVSDDPIQETATSIGFGRKL